MTFFASDTIRVKHSEQYQADNGDRLDRRRATAEPATHRAVNATLGTAGVVLGVGRVGPRRSSRWPSACAASGPSILEAGWSYSLLVLLGAVVAVIAMQRALITRDFTVSFVHDHGSSRTPPLFNVATMWSALEGSILLWALILAGFTVHVARKFRRRLADPLVGWALLTMFVVCALLLPADARPGQPVPRRWPSRPATTAPGPTRSCRSTCSWPSTRRCSTSGYVGFTVPFAFAIAALVTGRLGEGWLVETRRATLLAWGFLTVGIILGAWWSYEVLGWGGYWGWDPVENASLLPWLTGTAYLHSVMVQERRGMLRVWNLSLLCATFSLTILGTFLTRSRRPRVGARLHRQRHRHLAARRSSGSIVAVTLGLIGWRGDRLRSPGRIDSPVSREGAFLANNVLFAGFAFVVLLGTVFPLIARGACSDRAVTVGPPVLRPDDRCRSGSRSSSSWRWRRCCRGARRPASCSPQRLFWPAWAGAHHAWSSRWPSAPAGWAPVLTFGLGGFAAGAAVRQVVLATRRQGWRGLRRSHQRRHDRPPRRVIVVAVAIAAIGQLRARGRGPLRARPDAHRRRSRDHLPATPT